MNVSRIKSTVQSKSQVNENLENKFSIKNIIDKNVDTFIDKRSLQILSEEIDETDESTVKRKLDILVDKMVCDKSLISDKTFSKNSNEILISQIYTSLSQDSKKLLLDK